MRSNESLAVTRRGSDCVVPTVGIEELLRAPKYPVIDVRSPGEFLHGHIPGACNVPLFDDAERAEIGTLFNTVGQSAAMERGLEIAGSKVESLFDRTQKTVLDAEFVVHCWRGGMRSEGFARMCVERKLRPKRLQGGYKSFRRAAHRCFEQPRQLVILAGHSGSGKTRLLQTLRKAGEQVIDLEDLAKHRGSAFGGLGMPPQPTVEQFENELFLHWRRADPKRPLWMEDESRGIGRVLVPQSVWKQMSSAPVVCLEADLDSRVRLLIEEYGGRSKHELATAVGQLRKRLGGSRLKSALQALERDDLSEFTRLALQYYDKSYTKALETSLSSIVMKLPMSCAGDSSAAAALIALGLELSRDGRPNSRRIL